MNRISRFVFLWLFPLLASLSGLSSFAATTAVTVGDNFFSPSAVTINVNDTVQWNWSMTEISRHSTTSTSNPGLWDSGINTQPFSFSFTFTSAGNFPYWCSVHTSFMTGQVNVQAVNVPPTVAFTAPTDGATFIAPWTGTISATVSDPDDTVSRIQFFANGSLLGAIANPPMNPSLRVTNLAAGNYTLTAVATDTRGANATSAGVTIHLLNPAAVIGLLGNLAFGSLPAGQTATHTLVITNGGTRTLNVLGISYPLAFSGAWSGSIAPGSSQNVPVTFSPTDQAAYGGTMVVSNDAALGSGSRAISGTGYWPLTNAWALWWQNTNGTLALWTMLGTNAVRKTLLNPSSSGPSWRVAGITDLNGDNQPDLLFESTHGGVAAWLMDGTNRQSASLLTPGLINPLWHAAATGDLNGDGGHDILWQRLDGSVAAWLMNGLVATQTARLNSPSVDPSWHMTGTGDFNGDSKSDILWRHIDGRIAVWFMDGLTRTSAAYLDPPWVDPSWRLAASVDFNGDGHPGLLWQHTSGALAYWQMAGTNLVHSGHLNPPAVAPSWQVVGPR